MVLRIWDVKNVMGFSALVLAIYFATTTAGS